MRKEASLSVINLRLEPRASLSGNGTAGDGVPSGVHAGCGIPRVV